jgi:hypothetical protein
MLRYVMVMFGVYLEVLRIDCNFIPVHVHYNVILNILTEF